MLPLITAALGLAQQNQEEVNAQKQAAIDATMGRFSASQPPAANGAGKAGAMLKLGEAIGDTVSGKPQAAQPPSSMPVGPGGAQKLTPQGDDDLDDALQSYDDYRQTLGGPGPRFL